tara:strand:+ start:4815 stop:6851 length:2037 start_codon:yes stop_codon:yes gene_type:complete
MEDLFNNFSEFENKEEGRMPKKEKKVGNSRTPILDNFSRDLIKLAEEDRLDPVVGRKDEITRIAQILSRRKKNNPILIGEPGCGKTALVEGLAMRIHQGKCPRNLLDQRIVALDLTALVAGTKYRGQFEERMKAVLDELYDNPDIIIFIDEIHTVVGTGNSSGSLDAANIFKPALARGELQCIGATTIDEYRENIEKDGALERRFQKVMVEPTTPDETLQILKNIRERYEDHHKVKFSDDCLEACVTLAERYITDREFPDKAIDILDEVGAKVQVDIDYPKEIEELRTQISEVKEQKINVVKTQRFEKAAELRDKEKNLITRLDDRKLEWEVTLEEKRLEVSEDDIFSVVSQMTKIPLRRLTQNESENLLNLETGLTKSVIGQENAIKKIAKSIRRNRVGIREHRKPIGAFMFLGSTGIGKTLLAKAIAKEIFGDENNLIRVDMSEYRERFNSSRLIGSPPGYVGHNQGGQLTEAVRKKPYSVILLDEIEKAHETIYDLLLQILDEGHITDGLGRKINFKNTLIIMTSNIGSRQLQDFGSGLGFMTTSRESQQEELQKDVITKALKNKFSPEFLNRLDETIVFNPLDEENIREIVKLELDNLKVRLEDMGYHFRFNKSVIDYIAQDGFDEKFGARPIKRAIQIKIEDYISEEVLKNNIEVGKKYSMSIAKKDGKITIK